MATTRKLPLVPREYGLLYAFANSLDLRRYVQHGVPHRPSDEIASLPELEAWMHRHQLLDRGAKLDSSGHRKALELRDALRGFLQLAPQHRRTSVRVAQLNAAAANFPLIVQVSEGGDFRLQPKPRGPLSGLGRILADLQHATETGNLDRLKMCASDECQWVFYDRSKPATRRWCSSTLCGNRQKTRAYRTRQRQQDTLG
jgi:predicted RNA-binding Zn ribbon-like protein